MGFPTSVQTFTTHSAGQTITSSDINLIQTELAAVEAGLLTTGLTQPLPLPSGQIVFPATQAPAAGANTLDDYEEGTWTPAIAFFTQSPTAPTQNIQAGYYTKVGRSVTLTCFVSLSAKNSGSGNMRITGLPFTALSSTNARFVSSINWLNSTTSYVQLQGKISDSGTTISIEGITAAATGIAATGVAASDVADNILLITTVTYLADA